MSQKCPNCKITSLSDEAMVCKYCGSKFESSTRSEKFEQSSITSPSLVDSVDSRPKKETPTNQFTMPTDNSNFTQEPSSIPVSDPISNTTENQTETPSMEENSQKAARTSKGSNNWKVLALTTCFALLCALAVIGFQSFQVQSSSTKVKNLENKAMSQQKDAVEIENLNTQNKELTQKLSELKTELETKTKTLEDIQSKATSLTDESRGKDEKVAALQAENKALETKNANLASQAATASKELESLKNTPLGKLIQLNK